MPFEDERSGGLPRPSQHNVPRVQDSEPSFSAQLGEALRPLGRFALRQAQLMPGRIARGIERADIPGHLRVARDRIVAMELDRKAAVAARVIAREGGKVANRAKVEGSKAAAKAKVESEKLAAIAKAEGGKLAEKTRSESARLAAKANAESRRIAARTRAESERLAARTAEGSSHLATRTGTGLRKVGSATGTGLVRTGTGFGRIALRVRNGAVAGGAGIAAMAHKGRAAAMRLLPPGPRRRRQAAEEAERQIPSELVRLLQEEGLDVQDLSDPAALGPIRKNVSRRPEQAMLPLFEAEMREGDKAISDDDGADYAETVHQASEEDIADAPPRGRFARWRSHLPSPRRDARS